MNIAFLGLVGRFILTSLTIEAETIFWVLKLDSREDGQFGVIAACAAGGQGVGMILERYPGAKV